MVILNHKLQNEFFILKIVFFTLGITVDQTTKFIVMLSKKVVTKILNFVTPGVGVLMQWCDHICHILKINNFLDNIIKYIVVMRKDLPKL